MRYALCPGSDICLTICLITGVVQVKLSVSSGSDEWRPNRLRRMRFVAALLLPHWPDSHSLLMVLKRRLNLEPTNPELTSVTTVTFKGKKIVKQFTKTFWYCKVRNFFSFKISVKFEKPLNFCSLMLRIWEKRKTYKCQIKFLRVHSTALVASTA